MSRSIYARLRRRFGPRSTAASRREFLRSMMAGSAGLLLSNQFGFAGTTRSSYAPRVVVIGAGLAGLSCAYELKSAGYDVTVVEARERVGGRVFSVKQFVPGKNCEGGAELIGANHPVWCFYKEKFGLQFIDVSEYEDLDAPLVLDGKPLDLKEAAEAYEGMDAALSTINEDAKPINGDEPWNSPDAVELDKKSTADWFAGVEASDLARHAIKIQLTADMGQSMERQSYLGILSQVRAGGLQCYWDHSEIYRCKGGNDQLAEKLHEAIGTSRVVLGLPVTAVQTRDNRVVVTCRDRRTIEADDVVLAVPPSVWHKIQFTPELPADLKPQMGTNVKYLAAVKRRFWMDAGLAPDAYMDGMVSETWDGTDAQTEGDGACLVSFSGGPPAEECRKLKQADRDAAYGREIELAFPGFRDNFVRPLFMDWPSDMWTLCGYSFPAPGQITTIGPRLRNGLGRLHFAGEHTCYGFVGYMEGALNSGVSLARRLAVRDGVLKS